MTWIDKDCYKRGCACHDDRLGGETVEVVLAQTKQEPIAMLFGSLPVYDTPPQRTWVGLTPEEILNVFDAKNVYGSKWLEFAKAVENKLKEKNT